MPRLRAGDREFEVSVVVFDKDGTLIDFDAMWASAALRWVAAIEADLGHPGLATELAQHLGFDPATGAVVPDGPLAALTTAELHDMVATYVDERSGDAGRARAVSESAFQNAGAGELVTNGDVPGTFRRLNGAGLRVAIATSDDRSTTMEMVVALGVADLVAAVWCGDDAGPPKPDPYPLLQIARLLDVEPAAMVMVGDSVVDMVAGRAAGVAGCIGLTTATAGDLVHNADVVIGSLDDLAPV